MTSGPRAHAREGKQVRRYSTDVQDKMLVEERVDGIGDGTCDVALRWFVDTQHAVRLTFASCTMCDHIPQTPVQ